jgi:hypothetical protein
MLTLTGTVKAAIQTGGQRNGKGELVPVRNLVQVEVEDHNGRFRLVDLYVDDLAPYLAKRGAEVSIPVRAWAQGVPVNFSVAG